MKKSRWVHLFCLLYNFGFNLNKKWEQFANNFSSWSFPIFRCNQLFFVVLFCFVCHFVLFVIIVCCVLSVNIICTVLLVLFLLVFFLCCCFKEHLWYSSFNIQTERSFLFLRTKFPIFFGIRLILYSKVDQ